MKQSYYLYKSGRIQRKDNSLEIVYKDNTKKSIPIERVRSEERRVGKECRL